MKAFLPCRGILGLLPRVSAFNSWSSVNVWFSPDDCIMLSGVETLLDPVELTRGLWNKLCEKPKCGIIYPKLCSLLCRSSFCLLDRIIIILTFLLSMSGQVPVRQCGGAQSRPPVSSPGLITPSSLQAVLQGVETLFLECGATLYLYSCFSYIDYYISIDIPLLKIRPPGTRYAHQALFTIKLL